MYIYIYIYIYICVCVCILYMSMCRFHSINCSDSRGQIVSSLSSFQELLKQVATELRRSGVGKPGQTKPGVGRAQKAATETMGKQ